jgi:hypothetical protein
MCRQDLAETLRMAARPMGPTDAVPQLRSPLLAWLLLDVEEAEPARKATMAPASTPQSSDSEDDGGAELGPWHATRSEGASGLSRTCSLTFKRAYFRAYVEKHRQNPSHLGTIIDGSCPYVQNVWSAPRLTGSQVQSET